MLIKKCVCDFKKGVYDFQKQLVTKFINNKGLFLRCFYGSCIFQDTSGSEAQKQPPEVFCKKGVLKNFAKFIGKHLCQSLLFNKVAGLRPATVLKKETLVNFAKFLRSSRLLFKILKFSKICKKVPAVLIIKMQTFS